MSLDKLIIEALHSQPRLSNHFDKFASTGYRTYKEMIKLQLNNIKRRYGDDVYNRILKQFFENDETGSTNSN